MTDKPLKWPYLAADARDRAAETAAEAIRMLEPLTEKETDVEKLRRITHTMKDLFTILRLLESVGARTRP